MTMSCYSRYRGCFEKQLKYEPLFSEIQNSMEWGRSRFSSFHQWNFYGFYNIEYDLWIFFLMSPHFSSKHVSMFNARFHLPVFLYYIQSSIFYHVSISWSGYVENVRREKTPNLNLNRCILNWRMRGMRNVHFSDVDIYFADSHVHTQLLFLFLNAEYSNPVSWNCHDMLRKTRTK